MNLSGDSDQELRDRLAQVRKEIDDALARSKNRLAERIAIENELGRREEAKRIATLPPVDRSERILTSGEREIDRPDYREIDSSTGMQKSYVVLSAEERAKGFVQPVRRTYTHKTYGSHTTMDIVLAETYARTFCAMRAADCPLDQFVWTGTDLQVGSCGRDSNQ